MCSFLFILFLSITYLGANNFGTYDTFKDFNKITTHEKLSKIYPDVANDPTIVIPSRVAFLKKNPKAHVIKVTEFTKEKAFLAWVLESINKMEMGDGAAAANIKKLKEKGNTDFWKAPEDSRDYKDFIVKFYQKNFDEEFLSFKYKSEQYLHQKMFSFLDRKKFKKIDATTIQPTAEDEWKLNEFLMKVIADNLNQTAQRNLCANDRLEPFNNLKTAANVKIFHFLGFQETAEFPQYKKANYAYLKPAAVARKMFLNEYSKDDNTFHLFRASRPFKSKNGHTILDFPYNPDKAKFTSFSYAQSLLSHLFKDSGASPMAYWSPKGLSGEQARLQMLAIPYDKLRTFVKEKLLFIRPTFGVVNLFLGGEFHERSGLPAECFNDHGIRGDIITDTNETLLDANIREHPLSHLLFNTNLKLNDFVKKFFGDLWMPHVEILDSPEDNCMYKNNMKAELSKY